MKGGNNVSVTTVTCNSKGDIERIEHAYKIYAGSGDSTATCSVDNVYTSGRLTSWTATPGYENAPVTQGTLTWKQVSVPKKLVKKVKAQQRWIADQLTANSSVDIPLVVINK